MRRRVCLGDQCQWPTRPPSQFNPIRCHWEPTASHPLCQPLRPTYCQPPAKASRASSKKRLFPPDTPRYGFPSRFVSAELLTRREHLRPQLRPLKLFRVLQDLWKRPSVALLANNPCTLCRSDAKGRKQCNSNLFKKPVAAGVARKEPALTQLFTGSNQWWPIDSGNNQRPRPDQS